MVLPLYLRQNNLEIVKLKALSFSFNEDKKKVILHHMIKIWFLVILVQESNLKLLVCF